MSTRANIRIKQGRKTAYLYHHHDGNPNYLGSWISDYLKNLGIYGWGANDIVTDLIKGKCGDSDEFEFSLYLHTDTEYDYVVDCDKKTLKCTDVKTKEVIWIRNYTK